MTQLLHTGRGQFASRPAWEERGVALFLVTATAAIAWFGPRLPFARQAVLWLLLALAFAAALRRGGVKLLGPVFFYDLVCTARRGRYFAVRTAYAGVLSLLQFWLYYIWTLRFRDKTIPPSEMANFAETFFLMYVTVQFALVSLITPAYTAGAISEEKEHRTLEYLLATDLTDHEIVLGKLASRLANLSLLVVAGLPVLSLLQFAGGVDPDLLLGTFAFTGLTMASLAALSILFSVYTRRSREAILLTYVAAFVYVAVTAAGLALVMAYPEFRDAVIVTGAGPYTGKDLGLTLSAGNPFVVAGRLVNELASGTKLVDALRELLLGYAVFHALVIIVSVGWAVARLRPVAAAEAQGLVVRPGGKRRWGRPPVGRFPMAWKEVLEPGFRFSWLGRAITYSLVVFFAVPVGSGLVDSVFFDGSGFWDRTLPLWVQCIVAAAACLTLFYVAVRAAGSVGGERDRQTLDALVATPLTGRAILSAKWLGNVLCMRWALFLMALTWGLGVIGGDARWWVFPILMGTWLVYAAFLAQLGLWFSLVSPTTLRATLRTMLVALAVCVGHWLLWGYYLPYLLLTDTQAKDATWLVDLHFGLTPPAVMTSVVFYSVDYLRDPAGLRKMAEFAALGLCGYAAGTLVLAGLTGRRFRRLYNRDDRQAHAAPLAGMNDADILRQVTLPAVRSRRRRRLVIAAGVALPVLAFVGVYVYTSWRADRELRSVIAEIEATDPNWRFADIEAARKTFKAEENAAEVAIAARRLMPGSWPTAGKGSNPFIGDVIAAAPPEQLLDGWQVRELRQELNKVAAGRDKARTLESLPAGRIPVNWSPDLFSTLLPNLQEMRNVAVVLRLDASSRAQDGDADAALHSARAILNTSAAIGDEPLLISQLVQVAIQGIAVNTIERILAQGQPSPEELRKTQKLAGEREKLPLLLYAVRGERGAFHEVSQQIALGKVKLSQISPIFGTAANPALDFAAMTLGKGAHTSSLRLLNRAVDVARLPPQEHIAGIRKIEDAAKNGPWLQRMLLPGMFRVAEGTVRGQAVLRCAIAALAAERYRLEHERWPDDLQALVPGQLDAVPLDPYDGQPLRYRRTADGAIIYSVGIDLKDDGGKLPRKGARPAEGDVGVQLWDATRRRQPPRNPEVGPPQTVDNPP